MQLSPYLASFRPGHKHCILLELGGCEREIIFKPSAFVGSHVKRTLFIFLVLILFLLKVLHGHLKFKRVSQRS